VETEPLGIGSMTNLQHQRLVNLGCGRQWHPAWINFDTWAPDPRVRKHDLTKGIPLPDNSVDVVYHAHILEHFDRTGGLRFLRECFRVLNEGGIIRVVVPDLERIARLYLRALEQSINGSMEWQESYDWLMLEMYDQATRDYPGGGITDYFRGRTDPVPPFVVERMGRVPIERLMEALAATSGPQPSRPTFKKIFKRLSSVRTRAARAIVHGLLGEDDYRALRQCRAVDGRRSSAPAAGPGEPGRGQVLRRAGGRRGEHRDDLDVGDPDLGRGGPGRPSVMLPAMAKCVIG